MSNERGELGPATSAPVSEPRELGVVAPPQEPEYLETPEEPEERGELGAPVEEDEPPAPYAPKLYGSGPGDLITLEELVWGKKENLAEVEANAELKKQLEFAIKTASSAVKAFADRDFGKSLTGSETKTYEYEGDVYVEIDDCNKPEAVNFLFGELLTPLSAFYWRALPESGPPYTYLTIPHWAGIYSPEMGFTKNLDVIVKDQGWPGLIPLVQVKGVWGWPEVPYEVKQAVILTAIEFAQASSPYLSESIANYSYTTAIRTGPGQAALTPSAIPGRAQDLLMPYVRFQL